MSKLDQIRKKIDKTDRKIIKLLDKRFDLCIKTSKYKNSIENLDRENEIIKNLQLLKTNNIDKTIIENMYKVIFNYSKNIQNY